MKIMFRISPRTALIVILSSTLFVPPINAKNIETRNERKAQTDDILFQVSTYLEDNGLDKEVALEKVSTLFGPHHPGLQRHVLNLASHSGLDIEYARLIEVCSKRALYGRSIDFSNYHSLTGLVQDIKGIVLSESQRHAIHEVALLNQTV